MKECPQLKGDFGVEETPFPCSAMPLDVPPLMTVYALPSKGKWEKRTGNEGQTSIDHSQMLDVEGLGKLLIYIYISLSIV